MSHAEAQFLSREVCSEAEEERPRVNVTRAPPYPPQAQVSRHPRSPQLAHHLSRTTSFVFPPPSALFGMHAHGRAASQLCVGQRPVLRYLPGAKRQGGVLRVCRSTAMRFRAEGIRGRAFAGDAAARQHVAAKNGP